MTIAETNDVGPRARRVDPLNPLESHLTDDGGMVPRHVLLEMNQEVVHVVLTYKRGVWWSIVIGVALALQRQRE